MIRILFPCEGDWTRRHCESELEDLGPLEMVLLFPIDFVAVMPFARDREKKPIKVQEKGKFGWYFFTS
jgi:hypothetical protein